MEIPGLSELGLPEKEKKILESAIKVFSEKGFSAATTSEIAKNAGIAEGTIFRYFKTKKDILRGILIQTINLLSAKVIMQPVEKILNSDENKDLRVIIKKLLYDRMKLVESIFPMARIILTEALLHEDVREAIYQNIISKAYALFLEYYKSMVSRGVIRSNIKPEVLFRCVLGNIALFIAQRKLFGNKFEFEDLEKEFDQIIDVILYGISAETGEKHT
ncbi:MAG: TetR/AcrR family transcriptional regulator [Clostridia bacterium]|nr:TetR/AcrR family transcriptional regulator [Clostridia bacterium]